MLNSDGLNGATTVWGPSPWENPPHPQPHDRGQREELHRRGRPSLPPPSRFECLEWVLYEKALLKEDLGEPFLARQLPSCAAHRPPPTSTPQTLTSSSGRSSSGRPAAASRHPRCAAHVGRCTSQSDANLSEKKGGKKCISKQNFGINLHLLSLWLYPGGPPPPHALRLPSRSQMKGGSSERDRLHLASSVDLQVGLTFRLVSLSHPHLCSPPPSTSRLLHGRPPNLRICGWMQRLDGERLKLQPHYFLVLPQRERLKNGGGG